MTLRTAFISLLLFLVVCFVTIALFIPVQVLVERGDQYLPENFTIQSSQGTLVQGGVLLASPLFDRPLPIDWKTCFIDVLHPLGFCLSINIKTIDFMLALQPWSFGEETSIYNIGFDTDIPTLAKLHSSLSVLGIAQGGVVADVQKLSLAIADRRILDIDGELQLTNATALGLKFGTVNVTFSSEVTGDNDENTIVIVLEGGTIDEIKLQGSGKIDPVGNISMRFLFRTNNASVQQQLGVVTKKISDTEYEFDYTGKIF